MSKSEGDAIVDYYSGHSPDDRGRLLGEIQEWPDERLESVHDFIQWMFPLKERSSANPGAPVLDETSIRRFRAHPELRRTLRNSFVRMLRFYGLEIEDQSGLRVVPGVDFQEKSRNWLSPGNHNYLRITRILKSLRLLGLEQEAHVFFECLERIYENQSGSYLMIPEGTFRYWQLAIEEKA